MSETLWENPIGRGKLAKLELGEFERIHEMRSRDFSYNAIGREMGLSPDQVKRALGVLLPVKGAVNISGGDVRVSGRFQVNEPPKPINAALAKDIKVCTKDGVRLKKTEDEESSDSDADSDMDSDDESEEELPPPKKHSTRKPAPKKGGKGSRAQKEKSDKLFAIVEEFESGMAALEAGSDHPTFRKFLLGLLEKMNKGDAIDEFEYKRLRRKIMMPRKPVKAKPIHEPEEEPNLPSPEPSKVDVPSKSVVAPLPTQPLSDFASRIRNQFK